MRPECAFTVHADCGVRIVPFISGMLKTSQVQLVTYISYKSLLITISLCYTFLFGINIWDGMLKKQSPIAYFFYKLYIDLTHYVMHNTTHICTLLTASRFTFIRHI